MTSAVDARPIDRAAHRHARLADAVAGIRRRSGIDLERALLIGGSVLVRPRRPGPSASGTQYRTARRATRRTSFRSSSGGVSLPTHTAASPQELAELVPPALELDRRRVRARAVERFDLQRMVDAHEALYRRLAAARRAVA